MAALFVLVGCGGGGGGNDGARTGRGEVTGIVFDADGQPVRGATVTAGDRSTTTNEAGGYVLTGVRAEDFNVRARASFGGLVLRGTTLGRIYRDESTPSVNIAVYPEGVLTSLTGQIRDSQGRVLSGVRVVARPTEGGILSSAVALTDRNGFYELQDLAVEFEYQIAASARGIGDDSVLKTIPADPRNDDRIQDLVLRAVTTASPLAPTGVFARAYTTLLIDTQSRGPGDAKRAAAIEGVKRLRHPRRGVKVATRDTDAGNPISVDLTWDDYDLNPAVRPTGFIVYRNQVPTTDNGFLLLDPLASLFSDADVDLVPNVGYTYTLKALSTGHGLDTNVGRSELSAAATTTPLTELILDAPSNGTLSWQGVAGASNYTVYVYREYPTVNTAGNVATTLTTSGNAVTVNGLVRGTTYSYLVVGARADDTAETYSEIGTFVAP